MNRITSLSIVALVAVLGLASCSDDPDTDATPPATAKPSSGSTQPGGSSAVTSMTPAWQQVGNFDSLPGQSRSALIKVYPLQRLAGRLLLTVDIVAQGTAGQSLNGLNYLCRCQGQGDLQDVSLVDTIDRVRYGPLRAGSRSGQPYSSNVRLSIHPVGTTWRLGGFYPDPGPSVSSMGVDLQLAGIAPAIPIVDGGQPAPNLVAGTPVESTPVNTSASTDPSATAEPATANPAVSVQAPIGGDDNGPLITWTTPLPGPDAFVDKHDLIAKVVGGTVNEGGNRKQGIVTLNADVLFAFDSAKLSAKAGTLINQARAILTAKADPARPVSVTGYTDSKGDPSYNQRLSQQRANAAAKALRAGDLGSIQLNVSGRGETDPVAPNSTGGADNPRGRALNRRVEITYAPKPAAAPTTSAAPAPTVSAGSPAPGASPGPAITLPAVTVKSSGVTPATMSAAVRPIVVDGTMSLVSLDVTAEQDTLLIDAFTARSKANQDISAFTIVDPATKRAYLAAYDQDDPYRIMGTYTHRMAAGQPLHFAFYAAALPENLSTATVDLDQLGVAKNVPIRRN
jgi:outer membrane protein OmpA-like peptidoglycan-associated protein